MRRCPSGRSGPSSSTGRDFSVHRLIVPRQGTARVLGRRLGTWPATGCTSPTHLPTRPPARPERPLPCRVARDHPGGDPSMRRSRPVPVPRPARRKGSFTRGQECPGKRPPTRRRFPLGVGCLSVPAIYGPRSTGGKPLSAPKTADTRTGSATEQVQLPRDRGQSPRSTAVSESRHQNAPPKPRPGRPRNSRSRIGQPQSLGASRPAEGPSPDSRPWPGSTSGGVGTAHQRRGWPAFSSIGRPAGGG